MAPKTIQKLFTYCKTLQAPHLFSSGKKIDQKLKIVAFHALLSSLKIPDSYVFHVHTHIRHTLSVLSLQHTLYLLHTGTQTKTQRKIHTHFLSFSPTHTFSFLTLTHTYLSHTHTCTNRHTLILIMCISLSLKHTLTHTYFVCLSLFLTLSLSLSHI